ncbi:MAG TPA: hypothetical protein ENN22_16240, partial [bacterium]|nr:hypothetical protein [bacterium]
MIKFERAIYNTLFHCLQIQQNDSLVIIVDKYLLQIGQAFFDKAEKHRIDVALLTIPTRNYKQPEPAASILNLMKQISAVLIFSSHPLIHSKFVKQLCHNGVRVLCTNSTSQAQLERVLNINFQFIEDKSRRMADLFSIGKQVHLTSKSGTDLKFKIARHKGFANTGIVREPGSLEFLPAGEATITPDRQTTNGVVIVDGSIPPFGLIKDHIEICFKDGYAYHIAGAGNVEPFKKCLKSFGKKSRNIAEFGIGANPGAILTGATTEDE